MKQDEGDLLNLSPHQVSLIQASNQADSTLLITGSTGTGKSYLAHAIHRASPRRAAGKWHKVNLATLSENLVESELFGHERGAFTGADMRRVGRLEVCAGGTVFLDEIGELSPRLQAKLLDFIQYKRISPVGSNREIDLDVRIIAATNRDLEAAVRDGAFRADLYHRLNVFHIGLEDLAGSPKAVDLFARRFLEERARHCDKPVSGISEGVDRVLRAYSWPGNIRELQNVIEFGVAMERTQVLHLTSLPIYIQEFAAKNISTPVSPAAAAAVPVQLTASVGQLDLQMDLAFHRCKDAFERAYIERALKACSGQINLTSRRTGLNKVTLTEKIRKFGIDWRGIREEAATVASAGVSPPAT